MTGEWERISLREAGVSLIDCDHRTPPAADGGYPYIAIPQLREGRLALADVRSISPEHFLEWTRKAKPQHHDVILSRRCNPGETAFVPARLECALGQNLVLLRADGKRLFPPFLRWLVRGMDWWEQVGTFINVGAVFDSLRCADIPNFKLPIPPLAEQKAITAVLGALDDKIELNRRMNATLEAMARALFQSWFVDFDPVRAKLDGRQPVGMDAATAELFPAAFQDSVLGPIPHDWRVAGLGEVIEVSDSKRIPLSGREREARHGIYPYHGAAAVMDHVDGFLFDGIYVLMGEDGSVINEDGTPVLQYVWGKFWVNNHAHVLRGMNGISTEHLLLHLKGSNVAPFVNGAVQPKLNQGNMNRIPFIVPPPTLANVFANRIETLFTQIRANSDQSRTLATLRDTLLPKLLSGELKVSELNH
jgi:type I restriction enzyme S subunit